MIQHWTPVVSPYSDAGTPVALASLLGTTFESLLGITVPNAIVKVKMSCAIEYTGVAITVPTVSLSLHSRRSGHAFSGPPTGPDVQFDQALSPTVGGPYAPNTPYTLNTDAVCTATGNYCLAGWQPPSHPYVGLFAAQDLLDAVISCSGNGSNGTITVSSIDVAFDVRAIPNAVFSGSVIDINTLNPVVGALVTVAGAGATVTDSSGDWSMSVPVPDTIYDQFTYPSAPYATTIHYVYTIQKSGYQTLTNFVDVSDAVTYNNATDLMIAAAYSPFDRLTPGGVRGFPANVRPLQLIGAHP